MTPPAVTIVADVLHRHGVKARLCVLSLPDLVAAKKTQRDKDWPMIRRLIEADYFSCRDEPDDATVRFWLDECRTPDLLRSLVTRFPAHAGAVPRPALRLAAEGAPDDAIVASLRTEEDAEREADRAYWEPLRRELEQLRRLRGQGTG